MSQLSTTPDTSPNTGQAASPWEFYNRLIDEIPDDIAIIDYDLGEHWSYVEAECGMGIAFTCSGGSTLAHDDDLHGLTLKNVAELSKSWIFEEASLGVAALNAWFTRREMLDHLGVIYDPIEGAPPQIDEHPIQGNEPEGRRDAFDLYRPIIEKQHDASVVVVGHFPHVDRIAEYANLTVLERNCRNDIDTPDPACEYVMPEADYAFITGVTIINKTAPRLLELSKNAHTIMVGPSVIVTPILFDWGIETLGSRVVIDPEQTRYAIQNTTPFGSALQMCTYTCPEACDEVYPNANVKE